MASGLAEFPAIDAVTLWRLVEVKDAFLGLGLSILKAATLQEFGPKLGRDLMLVVSGRLGNS